MKRLAVALGVLAAALVQSGSLSGWVAAWHGVRATRGEFAAVIRERGAALDAEPLSRKRRIALGDAVARGLLELDRAAIVALAPRSTVGRLTVAGALDRQGAATEARALRATIGVTRPEELQLLSPVDLRAAGLDADSAGHCVEALPLLDAAFHEGLRDSRLRFKRAACLTQVGDANDALEALLPLYAEDQASRWVRLFLAQTEAALGHFDTAEKLTISVAWTDPDFYDMWRFAGGLLAATGRPRDAAYAFWRAFLLRPQNTWLRYEIAKQREAARAAAAGAPEKRSPEAPTPRP